MTRVNLLPSKARLGLSRLGFVRRLRMATVVFLVVFVFWAGGILLIDVYLTKQAKSISLRMAVSESRLKEFLPKLSLQSHSRARIRYASKIIANQTGLPFEVKDLSLFLNEEMKIRSFDYKQDKVLVVVEASGLKSLAKFEKMVDQLTKEEKRKKYQSISARSISIDEQGVVRLNLEIALFDAKNK